MERLMLSDASALWTGQRLKSVSKRCRRADGRARGYFVNGISEQRNEDAILANDETAFRAQAFQKKERRGRRRRRRVTVTVNTTSRHHVQHPGGPRRFL